MSLFVWTFVQSMAKAHKPTKVNGCMSCTQV